MKIRKEFKIGIFAVIVILVSWWGMSWLGGQNLFTSYNTYTVYYEDVSKDLQVSSRVYIRGVIVGNVQEIELQNDKVKVVIAVEEQYADMIPSNTTALITEGMIGGAQIVFEQGDSNSVAKDGATLNGRLDEGLMGMLADKGTELIDNLNTTLTKLDDTVSSVNGILEDNRENITGIVTNLEALSGEMTALVSDSKGDIDTAISDLSAFTTMLKNNTASIESMLGNLDEFSGELADSNIITNLNTTVDKLNGIIATIESGEGSVGKLLSDDAVYNSIDETIGSLNALLTDLKEHPMRYVHFSLFGKSEEDIAAKEAKQAKRAAKRASDESAE
jgi:phospholipid/cholesterol/gamma-HCH transport system substrate-binding protein